MDVVKIMGEPPNSLQEAIERGIALIDEHAPDLFEKDELTFTALIHLGFGQHMRNYWGLWSKSSGLYRELNNTFKLDHADDLSGIVLHAIYRTKKNLPLSRLYDIAASYHRHWEEMKLLEETGSITLTKQVGEKTFIINWTQHGMDRS